MCRPDSADYTDKKREILLLVTSPLTGTEDICLLKAYESRQLIADWLSAYQIDISAELSGFEQILLYRCNRTGLKFFSPSEVQGTAKLYERLQGFEWFYIPEKWEHNIAIRSLRKTDRVLEVGAGKGAFVAKCKQQGIDIVGLELNRAAILEAEKQALPVRSDDLSLFVEERGASFDAVCTFQVLEHVAQPRDFLGQMIKALRPGGSLMVSVPNNDSFLGYDYNLLDMPPHHMTQWNKRSLSSLPSFFPLKIREIHYEPLAPYHVGYFLRVYASLIKQKMGLEKEIPHWLYRTAETMLNAGLRRLVRGQSVFARFEKI